MFRRRIVDRYWPWASTVVQLTNHQVAFFTLHYFTHPNLTQWARHTEKCADPKFTSRGSDKILSEVRDPTATFSPMGHMHDPARGTQPPPPWWYPSAIPPSHCGGLDI